MLSITIGILLFVSFFAVLGIVIAWLSARNKLGKSNIGIVIILFAFLIVLSLTCATYTELEDEYTKNKEISRIDISSVNKSGEASYIVKDQDDNIYEISPSNIYKGDTNYIICIKYPDLDEKKSKFLEIDNCEYMLVVTNPDSIQDLPAPNK